VLVIDDDPLVLAGNRALLETLGCDVTTVPDGESARKAIAALSGRPVLILCDLWLAEGESGIDTLRSLSALTAPGNSGVLISGDTRPETIQAAKTAGLTLLHKPLAASRLSAVVMGFASTVHATAVDATR
jgi:two-component system, sensor histidine kinase